MSSTRYGRRQAYSEGSASALDLPVPPREGLGTTPFLHTVASSEGSDEAQGLGLELTPRLIGVMVVVVQWLWQ